MNAKHDGGPAFPVVASNGLGHVTDGMSLRDYFAAFAMHGYLTSSTAAGEAAINNPEMCAHWAYVQADVMLAERAK